MSSISKATDVITFPARTAIGIASAGVRTSVRLLGWAAEQAFGQAPVRSTPTVTVPEPGPAQPDVDPMAATRNPPTPVPAQKAPARKVPASQVPLKSAPTPSLPAALESFDELDDEPQPVPARKAPAKKAPAKKAPAKKAPSKQAAVLAPALGLSEDEVAEVIGADADKA